MTPDLAALWRCGDDEMESDRPCRAAQLHEAEVPDCLWHRAPLLALGANLEGPIHSAGGRRPVPSWPAPDLRACHARDPRVDEGTHAARDAQLIGQDDAASFAEGERPSRTPGCEPECPRCPE